MKIFAILFFFLSAVFALPYPLAGEVDIGRPVEGRPVEGRPVEGRPIGERPVEPRPIGSRTVQDDPVKEPVVPPWVIIGPGPPPQPPGTPPQPGWSRSVEARQVVPNTYIVQFKPDYTHEGFESYLHKKEVEYDFQYVYKNKNLFYGVSIKLAKSGDYNKMTAWEGIQTVSPVSLVTIPKPPIDLAPVPPVNS